MRGKRSHDDDDDDDPRARLSRWTEFDCPICSANNPYDDGFKVRDEVACLWCNSTFIVRANDDGYELKES